MESERNLQTVGYSLKTVVTKTFYMSQILLELEVGFVGNGHSGGFLCSTLLESTSVNLFYLRKPPRATNRAMKLFERVNQGLDG